MKKSHISFAIVLLSSVLSLPTQAQTPHSIEFTAPIPVDEQLVTGTLNNGLTYYIRHNLRPEHKAELRLVIRAGSLNEQDDQRGLAHLLEHMAFNGTTRFPKQTLVDQLQRMGVQFGADLNAYTGFNETVYILPIPLNDAKNLETGLQILEDWAFNMTLDTNAINQERPIVEEEWRLSTQNPESTINNKNISVLLDGSLYPKRLPIGDMNIVRNADPQRLRDFYRDWYRPDLMSVIVVGDVDVAKTRTMIEAHFGKAHRPPQPATLPSTQVANNTKPLIGIFSHKDLPQNSVTLTYKEQANTSNDKTVGTYLKDLQHLLVNTMINERLDALQDSAKPPFINAYSVDGLLAGLAQSKRAYTIGAQVANGKALESLKALHTENQRIIEHGFTQVELDRARSKILALMENSYNNRDKVESSDKANEYIRSAVENEPLPSLAWEYTITKDYLPTVTLDTLNKLARSYFTPDNRIAIINTNQTVSHLTPQTVAKVMDSRLKTSPPQAQAIHQSLLKTQPVAGQIISSNHDDKLDVTTWQLSNGATVRLKKTDFNDDKVNFASYADGGYSQFSDDVWRKTQWVYKGLDEAGVNGYNKTQLSQLLAGRLAKVQKNMDEDSQGLSGQFAPKDAETAFQLIYSNLTGTNRDLAAYDRYKQRVISETQNLERDRMSVFGNELMRRINHSNPRFTGNYPSLKKKKKMDYDLAFQNFQKSYQNANDMQFTFVGKIDEAQFKPLVETYIASLPSNPNEKLKYKDHGYRTDFNTQKIEIKKGKEKLSVVYIAVEGETTYNPKEALALRALGEILTIKLTEHLREDEGGVYTINASGEMSARPYDSYNFVITFPCAPDKVDALVKSAQRELDTLIQNGPDVLDVDKFKKSAQVTLQEQLKTNPYWVGALQNALKLGIEPRDILLETQRLNELNKADIQKVGQKYLSGPRGVAVLKPE